MTGADWGRTVTVTVWPATVCALHAIRRGGRALADHHNHRSQP